MNLLQGKSNQYLREAILEESVEKCRRYLTLKIGKADVEALTEVRLRTVMSGVGDGSFICGVC